MIELTLPVGAGPGAIDVVSSAYSVSLIGVQFGADVRLQLSSLADIGDVVDIYGGNIADATSTTELTFIAALSIPQLGEKSQEPSSLGQATYLYLYAVRRYDSGVGALTAYVASQETSGTVPPVASARITRAQWADGTTGVGATTYYLHRWQDPAALTALASVPLNVPLEAIAGQLSELAYSYVGNVLNVAGQTIGFRLLINDAPVTGGLITGLPSNLASVTTGTLTFATQTLPANSKITASVSYSALLTAAPTDIYLSAGG